LKFYKQRLPPILFKHQNLKEIKHFLGLLLCSLFTFSLYAQCDLEGIEITSIYTNRTADPIGKDTDGDGVAETLDEFVEICNTSTTTVDISGWELGDHSSGPSEFTIPGGTVLESGKCLAIISNRIRSGYD